MIFEKQSFSNKFDSEQFIPENKWLYVDVIYDKSRGENYLALNMNYGCYTTLFGVGIIINDFNKRYLAYSVKEKINIINQIDESNPSHIGAVHSLCPKSIRKKVGYKIRC